jgi:hypothetical protein
MSLTTRRYLAPVPLSGAFSLCWTSRNCFDGIRSGGCRVYRNTLGCCLKPRSHGWGFSLQPAHRQSYAGAITVAGGASLTGIGSVGALQIASGGSFTPGSGTPGTSMAIAGSLAFSSGALYVVNLNPTTSSFASVTGTATLAGATVNANFAAGSYLAKQYTILTAAGGLGGSTFAGVTNTNLPAGFSDSLSYSGNSVFLNLTATLGALSSGGLPQNQQNVGSCVQQAAGSVRPPRLGSRLCQ